MLQPVHQLNILKLSTKYIKPPEKQPLNSAFDLLQVYRGRLPAQEVLPHALPNEDASDT